jgi:hypothetical protein
MNITVENIVFGRFKNLSPKNDVEKLSELLDVYERWIEEHKGAENVSI